MYNLSESMGCFLGCLILCPIAVPFRRTGDQGQNNIKMMCKTYFHFFKNQEVITGFLKFTLRHVYHIIPCVIILLLIRFLNNVPSFVFRKLFQPSPVSQ